VDGEKLNVILKFFMSQIKIMFCYLAQSQKKIKIILQKCFLVQRTKQCHIFLM